MKVAIGTSIGRIDNTDAARALRKPGVLRFVGALLDRPLTLSTVAEQLDLPLNTAWRTADRLIELGLVRVVGSERRGGRACKLYAATSGAFFIPYAAQGERLPDEVVRELVAARVDDQVRGLTAAAARTLERSGADWGTLIYCDRRGRLVVRPDFAGGRTPELLAEGGPAYLNFYSDDLRLSADQAKQLQRELVALAKRYKACEGPGAYTFSVVLAPRTTAPKSRR